MTPPWTERSEPNEKQTIGTMNLNEEKVSKALEGKVAAAVVQIIYKTIKEPHWQDG